ncbi:hypothetical protein N7492_003161 [Penicillium capsulatum]|uniref:Histone chaperone domain-containing protein n=1 Tax=Penicillium capsulatum TaxID=69766 RepID=A0A9W9LVV1_9EURO|nr:hypothetical protein N7492_003161 [Penicillium capsulatum]KAJ6122249.1 hypothetical protein N7512_004714 [Penicillium capsulatum]
MSNQAEREAEDAYEAENDRSPVPGHVTDSSYATAPDDRVPVVSDAASFDDPMVPHYADTDQQLAQDENEAMDQSTILKGDRLRHNKPQTANRYNEGPDENDLPSEISEGLEGGSSARLVG